MKTIFEKFNELNLDTSPIGLCIEKQEGYFCTPLGARVFGWDNGIHYCFIRDFDEIVFCVNPETCCDHFVYPVAKNFTDFLRLLLTLKTTNTIQQVIWMNRTEFEEFINSPCEIEYAGSETVSAILSTIRERLELIPMENAFEYIKELQKNFPYHKIKFAKEFYDATGRPEI